MDSLKVNDDEIIEKLYESLRKINDINSYGQKILKSFRVFEAYSDKERQELTKDQNIGYVVEHTNLYDNEQKLRNLSNNEKKYIDNLL